ncbi:MAG: hypothetical protein IPK71_11750 [Myxococcales bacterium]|nr:hypothetical protein [Myxococcales bacterium]
MTLVRRLGAALVGALLVAMVPSCQSLPAARFCVRRQDLTRSALPTGTHKTAARACRDVYGAL